MKIAKASAIAALLLAVIGPVRGAAAGTIDTTIFVADDYDVTAYPIDASGDVAPAALTTDMALPSGIARDASGRIYVTNSATNTVTVYAAGANGNVPPIATIGGAKTGLSDPTGIALDSSGKIYVLNRAYSRKRNIKVYPPLGTSTGIINEAPIAAIAGSKTRLDDPTGIALDSQGNIYVANIFGGPDVPNTEDSGTVTVYAAGSTGNIAPIATISGAATGLAYPAGIALDSSGNIYVANSETANTTSSQEYAPSITVYPAGSKGNASPISIIAGDNTNLSSYPQSIALDSSRNLYAEGYIEYVGDTINVYPAGSNGNVSPAATIVGADTGLDGPDGIALDSGGNLYVSNGYGGPVGGGSVTIYPAGSSGDAVPIVTITSSFTGISYASSIAVDSNGKIYVANEFGDADDNGSITIYSADSYATDAPIATIAGDNTGLSNPFGIALDSAGNIFVLNSSNAITVYPPGSAGDMTPKTTINIDSKGNNYPVGMAVDPDGEIYVVNQGGVTCNKRSCRRTSPDNIAVYPADSHGNATPLAVISGPNTNLANPSAVALDQSGEIYVTNQGPEKCTRYGCYTAGPGSVTVYSPDSNGDVKPIATLSGPNTGLGLPYAITLDSNGNIYLLNDGGFGGHGGGIAPSADGRTPAKTDVQVVGQFFDYISRSVEPILIFAPGSNGDVPPIAGIGGPFTGLYNPSGIAVGPAGP